MKKIISLSLILLLIGIIFSVGVFAVATKETAKVTKASGNFNDKIVNNWVYINKAGKVTFTHKFCTLNSKGKSWGPTIGAYFSGNKYTTQWKYCNVTNGVASYKGCVTGQWRYVDARGKVVGSPITGCTTMDAKGQLGKEKPWCATKVAYVYNDAYGTQNSLCSNLPYKSTKKVTTPKVVTPPKVVTCSDIETCEGSKVNGKLGDKAVCGKNLKGYTCTTKGWHVIGQCTCTSEKMFCSDGKDNDGDKKIDCADSDCSADAKCKKVVTTRTTTKR